MHSVERHRKVSKRRDIREIIFAVLGALILLGTFVFKEILLDPLKDSMSRVQTSIGDFRQYRRYMLLVETIRNDNPFTSEARPHRVDTSYVMDRWRELNELSQLYQDTQSEIVKVGKVLRSSRLVDAKKLETFTLWQTTTSNSLDQIEQELKDLLEKTPQILADTKLESKRKDLTDLLSGADDALETITNHAGVLEAGIRNFELFFDQASDDIAAKEHRIKLYTYCTWAFFALGLALAVMGKIFHVSGVDAVE